MLPFLPSPTSFIFLRNHRRNNNNIFSSLLLTCSSSSSVTTSTTSAKNIFSHACCCGGTGFLKNSHLLRATGTVKQWSATGSFGFIIDDETRNSIFVSATELIFTNLHEPRKALVPLQRVRYDRVTDPSRRDKAEMCVRVRDISGAPLTPNISVACSSSSFSSSFSSSYSSTTSSPPAAAAESDASSYSVVSRNSGSSRSPISSSSAKSSISKTVSPSLYLARNFSTKLSSNNNHNNSNNSAVTSAASAATASPASIMGRNFGGVVVQLEGSVGFIQGNGQALRNCGQFLFSLRDVAAFRASSTSARNCLLKIGDRVTFDVIADSKRLGRTKCVNVRKDVMMSASAMF